MNVARILSVVLAAITCCGASSLKAQVKPPVDPPNSSGAEAFDWQSAWGSIHMNSFADGLNDPGIPATDTGVVPCLKGGYICDVLDKGRSPVDNKPVVPAPSKPPQSMDALVISNGIKFDIKNSLNNCMAQPLPTWAYNNQWRPWTDGQFGPCQKRWGLSWPAEYMYGEKKDQYPKSKDDNSATGFPHTMVYSPIWDSRSNDLRNTKDNGLVGCQQQISNSCVRDIHACVNATNPSSPIAPPASEAGHLHPVSHVFTPSEVDQLGGKGSSLPTKYYSFQDVDTNEIRLSRTEPSSEDSVPGSIQEVSTYSPHLARLKSFFVTNIDDDKAKFVVVDPSEFFDLRLYITGGKLDSGYKKFDSKGLVATPDTCPAVGLASGYSGICDPSGVAGCNLPIYHVGPTTSFKDVAGNSFDYADYKIQWSGYVKKWSVITVAEFQKNIAGREDLYLNGEDLNKNPIFMLTRANDYCESLERSSKIPDSPSTAPDMPCIHYLQWQATDTRKTEFKFVNLYNPVEIVAEPWIYSSLQRYKTTVQKGGEVVLEVDLNGRPVPAAGTGTDKYIGGDGSRSGYVSFLDTNSVVKMKEVPLNTQGQKTVGSYLDPKSRAKGVGITINPGVVSIVRVDYKEPLSIDGKSQTCVFIDKAPKGSKVFIPTNSPDEFKSFVRAAQEQAKPNTTLSPEELPLKNNVSVRSCTAQYMNNKLVKTGAPIPLFNVGGSSVSASSWTGTLSCNALANKPDCNQTKMISAQRYCQLEHGAMGDCGDCAGAEDPDKAFKFTNAKNSVNGEILRSPDRAPAANRCYLSAACFNQSASGCPVSASSGGHVFCLSADTKITMADGTQKEIIKIKAGEEVASFNAKFTRNNVLSKARVKATAITKKQQIIKINNLRITPLHKIVLANGRAVLAQDIKVGDAILKADGLTEKVVSVDVAQDPITVYNLILENGSDGYIANGLRVMSYPLLKGMEIQGEQLSKNFTSR